MASLREELRGVFISVIPIVSLVFVILLMFTEVSMSEVLLFGLCVIMVIAGIVLFLVGTDIGIIPASRAIGADLPRRNSIMFLIAVVFAISFFVTLADPDVLIFGRDTNAIFPSISVIKLLFVISASIGFLLVAGALRIIFNVSLKLIFLIGHGIFLVLCFFVPSEYFAMCFDAGAVALGPINIPVMVALGIGICSALSSRSEMDGFGLLGLAGIGPVIGVMLFCIFTGAPDVVVPEQASYEFTLRFLIDNTVDSVKNVLVAILPLLLFFAIFQKVFLRYRWDSVKTMFMGVGLAGVGIMIFLTGVYTGFLPVAAQVGNSLADMNAVWVILLGFAMGFLVTVAEPTVTILCRQVEGASSGILKVRLLKNVLALGVAAFVAIGMARLVFDIDLVYILVPGYVLTLILMMFCDRDLVGIAFDSGAVACGPMGVVLMMTMYAGLAIGMYGAAGAAAGSFGMIAMMVLAPALFVSALGVMIKIYKRRMLVSNELQG